MGSLLLGGNAVEGVIGFWVEKGKIFFGAKAAAVEFVDSVGDEFVEGEFYGKAAIGHRGLRDFGG